MSVPPGPFRVPWLLFRLGLRRWLNRTQAFFRRPRKVEGRRSATPRKGSVGWAWTALFFALFIFQGGSLSFQLLSKLAAHAERIDRDGALGVGESTYEALQEADRKLRALAPGDPAREPILRELESRLGQTLHLEDVRSDQRMDRLRAVLGAFRERGMEGVRAVDYHEQRRALGGLRFEGRLWPEGEGRARVAGALGLLLLALGVCQLFVYLGTANQDLGRVEWSLEWLYTFPVPAGRLFFAKVLEYGVVNAYGWIMTAPLLGVFLGTAGYGGWAVPLALAGTLLFGLVLGSLRVLAETWLRKTFPLNRLKNFQAGFTLLGTLSLMAVFAAAATPTLPDAVLDFMTAFPDWALWNPFSLPALLLTHAAPAAVSMLAAAILLPMAAVGFAQGLVRDGLVSTAGAYQGRRRAAAPPAAAGGFRGVVGKDLRLLFRDRNFLVQTLVVPLVVFGFQLVLNPSLLRNILSDPRHAAVAAYGVGSYVLLCSAFHVLTVEGNTLWLLYTFPVDLHRILIRKTVVWCGFAMLYTVGLLGAGFALSPAPDWTALSEAATALAGVGIFAFVVAAIGTLAVDPLQTEVHRKMRTDMVYLAMTIGSLFAWSLYAPSVWQRLVQVVLSALLALALWQKVRDRIPYLLDPTEAPPPRVAIADGLVAILAFFVLQGLAMFLLVAGEVPKGAALAGSYVLAGAIVSGFSLLAFWRHKVPRVLHAVGFRSEEGGLLRPTGWGLAAGALGAAAAWAYLRVLDRFEPLRALRDEALQLRTGLDPAAFGWLAAVAILAAPVFEEYLFRGLVYRGLRRSWNALPAVLASAFLFAIIHPPLSVVPVFVLGVLAAVAFERGKRLLAPILAHAVYNAAVVLLA